MSEEAFLFIDWETTGFKKGGAIKQEGQARACQVGMILTDANGRIINSFSQLIKPEGWKVSQFNIDSCGITQEDCEKYGVSAKAVFSLFSRYAATATTIIAHNADFDRDFCGRQLGNVAHNAMYDVEACKDIFFAARQKEAA